MLFPFSSKKAVACIGYSIQSSIISSIELQPGELLAMVIFPSTPSKLGRMAQQVLRLSLKRISKESPICAMLFSPSKLLMLGSLMGVSSRAS